MRENALEEVEDVNHQNACEFESTMKSLQEMSEKANTASSLRINELETKI